MRAAPTTCKPGLTRRTCGCLGDCVSLWADTPCTTASRPRGSGPTCICAPTRTTRCVCVWVVLLLLLHDSCVCVCMCVCRWRRRGAASTASSTTSSDEWARWRSPRRQSRPPGRVWMSCRRRPCDWCDPSPSPSHIRRETWVDMIVCYAMLCYAGRDRGRPAGPPGEGGCPNPRRLVGVGLGPGPRSPDAAHSGAGAAADR